MSKAVYISWCIVAIVVAYLLIMVALVATCWIYMKLMKSVEVDLKSLNKSEEEKKDEGTEGEEFLDYEAPEDPVEKPKPKYWYVYAENSEEMYGLPKGRDIHIGAYKTEAEAERLQYILAKEGKWENMFVYPDDRLLCSDTVRMEVGELEDLLIFCKRYKLEENGATEKKEYEDVRIELSEDKQEQDEPLPESEVAE